MNIRFSHAPIDIHSHFNHGVPLDYNPHAFAGIHCSDLDFLHSEYENVGISAGAFSSYASVLHSDDIIGENEWLAKKVLVTPWMYQWAVIHPEQPDTFAQARELLKTPKCLGLKIHPYYHGYSILTYADLLFSFAAENRTVLLMHPDRIEEMPAYADLYPEMKLIIAHLGSLEHINAIKRAKYGNIYTDTSGGASNLNNIVEYAVSEVGSEHILFGTDTYSCAFQLGRIALGRLTQNDKENILFRNAEKLFPKAFSH